MLLYIIVVCYFSFRLCTDNRGPKFTRWKLQFSP